MQRPPVSVARATSLPERERSEPSLCGRRRIIWTVTEDASTARVRALLEGLSDLEIRSLCLQALRQIHARHPTEDQITMHGHLGRELVPLLEERKGLAAGDLNADKERFLDRFERALDGWRR